MKKYISIISLFVSSFGLSQFNPLSPPNDCGEQVAGCTTPAFPISPNVPGTNNIIDFGTGTISNPTVNPQGVNAGCLLSGETSSTFISITVVSSGTLSWSIQGPNAGCFDWIMWPFVNSTTTCAGIFNGTLAPVACNWNGACGGFTGMAPPGALPAGANATDFQPSILVTAGQTFLLCLSNFSGTSQNVNLNFFGTANVACNPSIPDQTICAGTSATINVATPGYVAPTFQWLTTTGVSNTTGGSNVIVTPTATTTYTVIVTQAATATTAFVQDTINFTLTVVAPPTPNAGMDDTVCFTTPNTSISLSGAASNASNTLLWQFVTTGITPTPSVNFTPNFSTPTPTVSVNQPGTYRFVLRETSTVCGAVRDTAVIFVKQMTVQATKIDPSCAQFLDGQISITGVEATEFSIDNGVTWSPTSTFTGIGGGTYTVCARDINNCQACMTITLVDPPVIELILSNDTLICQNGTASLFATTNTPGSYNFSWSHLAGGPPNFASTSTELVSPTVNSYYSVQAFTVAGCSTAADSIYVTLNPPISAVLSPDTLICPGYATTIVASATGGIGSPFTFNWSNGSVGTGIVQNISVNPPVSAAFSVTITDACESSPVVLTNMINVSPLPLPAFTSPEPEKCESAEFDLFITTDPTTYVNSVWEISDGQQFLNMDSIVTTAMPNGTYTVKLTLFNQTGCIDSVTNSGYLVSHELPVANFKSSPNQPTMFNTKVEFANFSQNAVSSSWTFESGDPASSVLDEPSVLFPDGFTGTYEVGLIVLSNFGCADTLFDEVEIFPEVLLYAPNSFTPDGDEFNPKWRVYLEGVDPNDFRLEVRDRWGQIVYEAFDIEAEWDGTFGNRKLPDGIYSWNIRVKDRITDAPYIFTGNVLILR